MKLVARRKLEEPLSAFSPFERQEQEQVLDGYTRVEDIGDEEEIIRKKSKKLRKN